MQNVSIFFKLFDDNEILGVRAVVHATRWQLWGNPKLDENRFKMTLLAMERFSSDFGFPQNIPSRSARTLAQNFITIKKFEQNRHVLRSEQAFFLPPIIRALI